MAIRTSERDPGQRFALRLRQSSARSLTLLCACSLLALTLAVLAVLTSQSAPFFSAVPLKDFLLGTEWRPTLTGGQFGVLPLVAGSVTIMIGSGMIALPLGVLSAIFLNEFAGAKLRSALKLPLELLAAIPAVVYGYIGLFYVTPMLRHVSKAFQASNATSAAIVVGLMILPLVSSLCEDAIHAVPRALREGGYALGLTKAEVTSKLVLPSAYSGIAASFVLALARALGETMAVTLAAGSTPLLAFAPQKGMATMTSYIVTTSEGEAASSSARFASVFAVGITLFALTLAMNLLAVRLVDRFRRRYL